MAGKDSGFSKPGSLSGARHVWGFGEDYSDHRLGIGVRIFGLRALGCRVRIWGLVSRLGLRDDFQVYAFGIKGCRASRSSVEMSF